MAPEFAGSPCPSLKLETFRCSTKNDTSTQTIQLFTNKEVKFYLPGKEVSFGADPNGDGATDEEHDRTDPDQNRGSGAKVIKLFWGVLFFICVNGRAHIRHQCRKTDV